jgi:hypothetical protein
MVSSNQRIKIKIEFSYYFKILRRMVADYIPRNNNSENVILENIKERMNNFEMTKGITNKEICFIDILHYLVTKPMFLIKNQKFANTVVNKIEYFMLELGELAIVDWEYWLHVFKQFIQ